MNEKILLTKKCQNCNQDPTMYPCAKFQSLWRISNFEATFSRNKSMTTYLKK